MPSVDLWFLFFIDSASNMCPHLLFLSSSQTFLTFLWSVFSFHHFTLSVFDITSFFFNSPLVLHTHTHQILWRLTYIWMVCSSFVCIHGCMHAYVLSSMYVLTSPSLNKRCSESEVSLNLKSLTSAKRFFRTEHSTWMRGDNLKLNLT